MNRASHSLALLGALFLFCGCAQREVSPWTRQDHDGAQRDPAAASAPMVPVTPADIAWAQHCARCHGTTGRGDGPEGPMVSAPDLSTQPSKSRQELRAIIQTGRGRMPAFQLPEAVIDALAQRVEDIRSGDTKR